MEKIAKELDEIALRVLLKRIRGVKRKEDLRNFLNRFLTPQEQLTVKKRLLIDIFLKDKKGYKEIGEILGVSKNTISFVKRELKRPPKRKKVFKPISEKDLKERKSRFPTIAGKGRWRFLDVEY